MNIVLLAQARSVHTCRWAEGLMERGHEVTIVSNGSRTAVQSSGVETIILPGNSPAAYFFGIPGVRRIISRINPDIVHAHFVTGFGLWGWAQKKAPLIASVWGSDIEDAINKRFTTSVIVRRVLSAAKFVTVTSRYLLEKTISFDSSVKDKVFQIPFGVDIPGDYHEKMTGNAVDHIKIIFAKQYHPYYAPELVIKAFALAFQENDRLRLQIIGGGYQQSGIVDLARSLNVLDYISFEGEVVHGVALKLINDSDIMMMPSNLESFGVAALEATARGVPVIATDVGGIPEIIRNNVNGLLIASGDSQAAKDAILTLAADPELRSRMGAAGRKLAREMYDFQHCLDKMEQLYRRAVTGI